jgi:hypothetical protein
MGLFDFLKPKKNPMEEMMEKLANSIFPKGEKDIDAGTKELLYILNNKIDFESAKGIFLKSSAISRISDNFDLKRLKAHLAGYCLEHFSEKEVEEFYRYLHALSLAMKTNRNSPSEVKREGDNYIW